MHIQMIMGLIIKLNEKVPLKEIQVIIQTEVKIKVKVEMDKQKVT